MKILKVTTRRTSYAGRIATCTEYRLQKSAFGLRIHAMTFDGESTTLVRTIDHDGRRPDFKTFASVSVPRLDAEAEVKRQAMAAGSIQAID